MSRLCSLQTLFITQPQPVSANRRVEPAEWERNSWSLFKATYLSWAKKKKNSHWKTCLRLFFSALWSERGHLVEISLRRNSESSWDYRNGKRVRRRWITYLGIGTSEKIAIDGVWIWPCRIWSPFIHTMLEAGLLPMAVQVISVSFPSLTTSSRDSMIRLPGGTGGA